MRKTLTVVLITGLLVSACGWSDSSLNPTNWFGGSTEIGEPIVDDVEAVNPLIPEQKSGDGLLARPDAGDFSVPIKTVTELRVEPAASGAIVYAVGLADRQGAYSAVLVPDPSDGNQDTGTLTLTFRVTYPENQTAVGSEATRTIHAAHNLSVDTVNEIQTIRVVGAENARESRRR